MIPPEKQLLIAIWKIATPDSYRSICQKFGVSFAAAFSSLRRVTSALVKIAPHFITWPENEKFEEISNQFEATSGFPKVIGAINGTHINIPTPRKHSESVWPERALFLPSLCRTLSSDYIESGTKWE
ncbi:uncharacterized protein LOC141534189 isoform X1 [Cotesia typhae]|uniref:uncharacterized protein LOC141534189 isoform X1 n=1 Tax=Cotesia typhae TaxID=2053667 RepID=UPI003D688B22